MRVVLHVVAAGHHEDPAIHLHHVDRRAIQPRQHRAGDHFLYRAERRVAATEIQHAIERSQQRIDLMRAEQHGDAELLLQRARQFDHRTLVMRVQADQRFVKQQKARTTEQCLGQQQTLPLAARCFGQWPAREVGCSHHLQRPLHLAARGGAKQRQSPAMAVGAAGDEVPAGEAHAVHRAAHLRHVAHCGIAARHGLAEHADRSAARRQQAEDRAHQRGLARAVRAEHADEFVVADRQIDVGKYVPGAERQGDAGQFDGVHDADNACAIAASSRIIQSWNLVSAGSVSVTPTTGMFADRAMPTRRVAAAPLAWLL